MQRTIPSCGPARSRHTGAELAYYDTGVRTSVRRLAGCAVTFLEFRIASSTSFSFTAQLECDLAPAEHGILHYIDDNIMSSNRSTPTTRSGSGGPSTRSSTARGARPRGRAQASVPTGVSDAQATPRAIGKGPKGKGKQPGSTSGSGAARRPPYEAKETPVKGLGTPSGPERARGARARHTSDDSDSAARLFFHQIVGSRRSPQGSAPTTLLHHLDVHARPRDQGHLGLRRSGMG